MEFTYVTLEELHLAYRVVDVLQSKEREGSVTWHALGCASETLRLAYRSRTLQEPMPGQLQLDGS